MPKRKKPTREKRGSGRKISHSRKVINKRKKKQHIKKDPVENIQSTVKKEPFSGKRIPKYLRKDKRAA